MNAIRGVRNSIGGFAVGAGLGVWTSAWVVGFLALWEGGRLTMGILVPARFHDAVAMNGDRALGQLWSRLSVDLPTNPLMLAALLVACCALAGAVLGALGWILDLDRRALGRKSLWWALRGFFAWQAVLSAGILIGLSAVAWQLEVWVLELVVILSVFLGAAVMPFVVCRGYVVARPKPAGWWAFRWPGVRPVLWFLGIGVVVLLVDAPAVIPGLPSGLLIAIGVAGNAAGFLAPLLQARVLLSETPVSLSTVRSTLSREYLGPWAAYNLWLIVVALAFLGPVAVVCAWLWKVVTAVAAIAAMQGMALPAFWRALISSFLYIGRYPWLILPLPLAFIYWLGAARLTYSAKSAPLPNPKAWAIRA